MLSHSDWSRPIYASISLGPKEIPYLRDHFVLEGMAYRIVPDNKGAQVDVERMYDNVMHRFRYGGLSQKGLYVDDDVMYMAHTHQYVMSILIDSLLARGDKQRALAVAEKWEKELPSCNIPYTDAAVSLARCYYENGKTNKGDAILANLLCKSDEWLSWIASIGSHRQPSPHTALNWLETMQHALASAIQYERTSLVEQFHQKYENHVSKYQKN